MKKGDVTLNKEVKRRELILSGNIWKTIVAICMPLMIYQAFNSWYTVADQIIAASISADAQSAIASIAQIRNTISAFGAGLAAGGGVLVARYYGAGQVHDARSVASNLLLLALILSLILSLIVIPLAYPILKLCQIAPASIEIGQNYFRLQMLELAFVGINNVFIGLEKAKGNSKSVLWLNLGVVIVKLGLTCLFVYGFNLKDIVYVELATIIGQGLLMVVGIYIMFRKNNILRMSFRLMKLKRKYVLPIISLSLPIFLGKFVMNLGKVIVNGMCGAYWNDFESETVKGSLIVGTLGISNNMSGLITSPTNSFEEGESSIVSQNIGNKNMKRALNVFKKTFILATIVSVLGWILMRFVLINPLTDLFTAVSNKADESNMEIFKNMIREIFVYDSLSIPALGIAAAVLGLLYGFGQTKLSTIFNLSRIGSRIVILYIFHLTPLKDNPTLCAGLAMGISNCIILLMSIIFLIGFLLHINKKGFKGMKFSDPEPEVSKLQFDEEDEALTELKENDDGGGDSSFYNALKKYIIFVAS